MIISRVVPEEGRATTDANASANANANTTASANANANTNTNTVMPSYYHTGIQSYSY